MSRKSKILNRYFDKLIEELDEKDAKLIPRFIEQEMEATKNKWQKALKDEATREGVTLILNNKLHPDKSIPAWYPSEIIGTVEYKIDNFKYTLSWHAHDEASVHTSFGQTLPELFRDEGVLTDEDLFDYFDDDDEFELIHHKYYAWIRVYRDGSDEDIFYFSYTPKDDKEKRIIETLDDFFGDIEDSITFKELTKEDCKLFWFSSIKELFEDAHKAIQPILDEVGNIEEELDAELVTKDTVNQFNNERDRWRAEMEQDARDLGFVDIFINKILHPSRKSSVWYPRDTVIATYHYMVDDLTYKINWYTPYVVNFLDRNGAFDTIDDDDFDAEDGELLFDDDLPELLNLGGRKIIGDSYIGAIKISKTDTQENLFHIYRGDNGISWELESIIGRHEGELDLTEFDYVFDFEYIKDIVEDIHLEIKNLITPN